MPEKHQESEKHHVQVGTKGGHEDESSTNNDGPRNATLQDC